MHQVRAEVHFTVNIDEEDGCYWAEVAEIPGCFVWGRSKAEIRDALEEAIHATVHSTGRSTGPHVVLRDLEPVVGDVVTAHGGKRRVDRAGTLPRPAGHVGPSRVDA